MSGASTLVSRADLHLAADPTRVLARLFIPGQELHNGRSSRTSDVVGRVLELTDELVAETLKSVLARFAGRHKDLRAVLQTHFERVAHRVDDESILSTKRRLLIGAYFTKEYSVEAAALFNPSMVAHPDQSNLKAGMVRFVMSLRAVGEGHISSLEFRTGVVGPGNTIQVDAPGPFLESGTHSPAQHHREVLLGKLNDASGDEECCSFLRRQLPAHFDDQTLEHALSALISHPVTRTRGLRSAELARQIAVGNYVVEFDANTALPERILWPHSPAESQGIEDARFVRFVDDDESITYLATYTAFDGDGVAPQLIRTTDFRTFEIGQLAGEAAQDKGMALFPRKVRGQYVALSRSDRESSGLATSTDGLVWSSPTPLQSPRRPWEVIQLGNAGSPIETEEGWLVITHGVGPMREYSLGAILLDIDDPSRVIGALREPLLRPEPDERDGYVPNVVYSCGAMALPGQLVLPYGISDSVVRFAFVDMPRLLKRLLSDGPPPSVHRGATP